jgi:hypothetical protein
MALYPFLTVGLYTNVSEKHTFSIFSTGDWYSIFLRNVGNYLHVHTVLLHKRLTWTQLSLWLKSQIIAVICSQQSLRHWRIVTFLREHLLCFKFHNVKCFFLNVAGIHVAIFAGDYFPNCKGGRRLMLHSQLVPRLRITEAILLWSSYAVITSFTFRLFPIFRLQKKCIHRLCSSWKLYNTRHMQQHRQRT